MPTPGWAVAIVGAIVAIVGAILFSGVPWEALVVFGVGLGIVGIGIAMSGGLSILYFVGTASAILIIVGVLLRLTGSG